MSSKNTLNSFGCLGMVLLFAFLIVGLMGFKRSGKFEKIQMDMLQRTAENKKMTQVSAQLHYMAGGKMIANFILPKNYIVINNSKGEMQVYDPKNNSVKQINNYSLSTESSLISFFISGQMYDMGLSKMGFILMNTEHKGSLTITNWSPPEQASGALSKIKLVLEDNKPIYIEYHDNKKKLATKTYYYKYLTFENLRIPTAVTSISYIGKKDSIVSKTSFSNIKLNGQADSKYFQFTIPNNAKLEK